MLGNKAKPRRLNSKGNLYNIYFRKPSLDTKFSKVGRALSNSIPVLSIFALMGIMAYGTGLNNLVIETNHKAYAVNSSEDTSNSTSLIIDNGNIKDTINATTGETTYVSHTVQVKADDIESYNLIISGPTNLTGNTTISGAGGKAGNAMTDNTWGYGWGDTTTDNSALVYNSLNTTGQSIASGTPDSNAIDFTKKLVFAAKFGDNANSGHYTASVNLNLVAEPKKVVGFNISSMQEMTPEICAQAPIGTTGTLKDSRDNSDYTIRRNEDGKCWMTQNLRTVGSRTLTAANSDVSTDFALPSSTPSGFGSTSNTSSVYYDSNNIDYGSYYTWHAATTGTGGSTTSGGEVMSSVCPKGWKLPSQNDYLIFLNKLGIADNNESSSLLRNDTYKYQYAGIFAANLTSEGSAGYYWTRTAYTGTYYGYSSYAMYLASQKANATSSASMSNGASMRCVAYDKATPQYAYTVTFKNDKGVTLSAKSFSVVSTDNSYNFYPTLYDGEGYCDIKSWKDESGATYTNEAITLTPSNPSITLTSTGTSGWCEPN